MDKRTIRPTILAQLTLRIRLMSLLTLSTLWMASCVDATKPARPMRTLMMTTELVPDSAVYRFYDSMHSAAGVWPALEKANRAAGIEEVRIWRFDNRLAMLIRLPADADPATTDSLYLSADPSVADWGRMMSNLQRALPGVDTGQKWVEMQTIHHYLDGRYLK
ncbi:MAG: L-rhamnose mutarotase [Chitinophagia bacterium]|nr:L-rhamnose mutarotase [Chitinophagia bacterium]